MGDGRGRSHCRLPMSFDLNSFPFSVADKFPLHCDCFPATLLYTAKKSKEYIIKGLFLGFCCCHVCCKFMLPPSESGCACHMMTLRIGNDRKLCEFFRQFYLSDFYVVNLPTFRHSASGRPQTLQK